MKQNDRASCPYAGSVWEIQTAGENRINPFQDLVYVPTSVKPKLPEGDYGELISYFSP